MIQSDLARINQTVFLDDIIIEEAEKLWINRLKLLHLQCNPQPNSAIAPLEKKILTENALGERINLRNALNLGGKNFEEYINRLTIPLVINSPKTIVPIVSLIRPDFLQKWDQVFKENQQLKNILDYSDEEFLEMFRYILGCLGVENINHQFLGGINASKGFTFTCPKTGIKKGLIVNNTRSGNGFTAFIRKCQEVFNNKRCQQLILIRNVEIPKTGIGAEIYNSLFTPASKQCIHHKLTLEDLHYLFTYNKLYKDAVSGDLYIKYNPISRQELLSDMQRYNILNNCVTLKSLGLVNYFPEMNIFKDKLENILHNQTEMSFSEIHGKITEDKNFYNCFIPPYFFRNVISHFYRNNSVVNILNYQDQYTQWILSPLN